MQPDDHHPVDDDAVPTARSTDRRGVTRRVLMFGGIGVVGVGAAAYAVHRLTPRDLVPEGAGGSPRPIAPPPVPSTGATSPAAQTPDTDVTLAIWAHADDDIIFSNPGLADAIAAGSTVRTVFVSAGDGGRGFDYALQREQGALRGYDRMRGKDTPWTQTQVTLLTGARITRYTPADDPQISITMMRLPDGGLDAKGFTATGNAGLSQLLNGQIAALAPLDGSPAYDLPRLTASIAELIRAARPARISTNIPRESAWARGDHPDHSCIGSLVRVCAPTAGVDASAVSYFLGYPSAKQPVNVEGQVLDDKVEVYRVYSEDDPVVRCADASACLAQRGFGDWLRRSYAKGEGQLRLS